MQIFEKLRNNIAGIIKRNNLVLILSSTTILTFMFSTSQTFAKDVFGAPEWTKYVDMVDQYCLEHVEKILQGGNPVQDLVIAGYIPDKPYSEEGLADRSCSDVHKMKKFNDEGNRLGIPWG